jgi:flavoprotein
MVIKSYICTLRVEVPDGSYTLVPVDVNEGAGGDVHYVTVEQDQCQSPEVCLTSCANEGKPRFIH